MTHNRQRMAARTNTHAQVHDNLASSMTLSHIDARGRVEKTNLTDAVQIKDVLALLERGMEVQHEDIIDNLGGERIVVVVNFPNALDAIRIEVRRTHARMRVVKTDLTKWLTFKDTALWTALAGHCPRRLTPA